jgi:hypothetical protein
MVQCWSLQIMLWIEVLPGRLHAAGCHQRDRLVQQADLLFDIAADTLRTIAADPKHLGIQIGAPLILNTWSSALTHPSRHLPKRWPVAQRRALHRLRPGFFLPVRALSRLFRRRSVEALANAHRHGQFSATTRRLPTPLPLRDCWRRWVPETGLCTPSVLLQDRKRYSLSVALYAPLQDHELESGEFMRHFLHVSPGGLRRIRRYGLPANPARRVDLAKVLNRPPVTVYTLDEGAAKLPWGTK